MTPGDHLACGDLEDYVTGTITTQNRAVEEDPMTDYGMTVTTTLTMDEAEAQIRTALAEQGFGVLTEIDVAATLKEKIDVDRAPYKILGACNPHLANRALLHDEAIGLLLPCNVTVSVEDGMTTVRAMDPSGAMEMIDDPVVSEVAADIRKRLERAIDSVGQSPGRQT